MLFERLIQLAITLFKEELLLRVHRGLLLVDDLSLELLILIRLRLGIIVNRLSSSWVGERLHVSKTIILH